MAVIIGNDKGGVGKDLVAEGIYLAARQRGQIPVLIEVEIEKRLANLYPEAVHVMAGSTSPEELYRNPDKAFAPLDDAMTRAQEADLAIVSLGANLTQALQVWAQSSSHALFGEGETLTFAIVLTMARGAMSSGLSNLYELGRLFPASRRVAVLNESVADFIDGDKHLPKRLKEAKGKAKAIETVKLPRMAAPAWGYLQNMGSLPEIAAKKASELVAFGLPPLPSARSLVMVEKWIADDLITPLSMLLPSNIANTPNSVP
ncbi:hypothetical protein [Lichenifustis flavocetrariae]|uniref:Uncharacterized protein n=1 Tax=Lichenifustis flavocetrariae TaxID=2949735 RepID=A0AA41Z1X0_9HYPH|nr:hypothetical protein [Lichenifustis flavocetrariae]MCW6511325.1 hypothetical protein [Lichenifustis flavocetrariae]